MINTINLEAYMQYKMKISRPASWWNDTWREGTPLGNGRHGALMYGAAANERILLTHTFLWREGKQADMPDVSYILPKMRKLILEGRMFEADRMLSDELLSKGYNPSAPVPFPAADLHLSLTPVSGFSRYNRELNMSTAEGIVHYCDDGKEICRKVFVSRADDVIVVETDKNVEVNITIHKSDVVQQAGIKFSENPVTYKEGEWIFFKAEVDNKEHGVVARVIKGEKTLIICRMFTDGDSNSQFKLLKEYISTIKPNYNSLLTKHIAKHQELYNRCQFHLEDLVYSQKDTNRTLLDASYGEGMPNEMVERMWALGRYLFICGTGVGGNPCNLTGLWSGEYKAYWAFNMANINLEMIYWHVLSGNLTELMLPVFDYYEKCMDDMRENAKKMFGCRGIYLPAVTAPGAIKHVNVVPHITNWTAGAGWIGQLYYEYWLYTKDEKFLKNRALPFLLEVSLFYEDFLVWNEDKWIVCPSVSPENHTISYRGGAEPEDPVQTSINATMDVAIIKEVFAHLIELGKQVGCSEDEIEKWIKFLNGAPEYEYNEFGAPREWLHKDYPDRDFHRHQSHLYPVFPGLELSRSDNKTLDAYRIGGIRRLTIGLEHQSSWSLVQNANLLARTGDAENALKCLELISKSTVLENFFTLHNDWRAMGIGLEYPIAPFQIDANIGWASAIQEMLLYSDTKRIDILPALPKKWGKGNIGWLNTRCGVNVKIDWNKKKNECTICLKGNYDTKFTLYLPNKESVFVKLYKGEEREMLTNF